MHPEDALPQQETFFEHVAGNRRVEVIKPYDRSYAREVFGAIGEEATKALAAALDIEGNYDPGDIPDPGGAEYEDFLWRELSDAAREDVRQSPVLYSFFVVTESREGKSEDLYIAPDWPSAEAFARHRLAGGI